MSTPQPTPPPRADATAPVAVGIDYRPALLGASGIPRAVRELARALADRADVDLHLFGHSWARASDAAAPPAGARLHRSRTPGRALPWLAGLGVDAAALCGRVPLFHWTDYVHPPVGRRTRVVLTLHDCAFAVDPSFHGDGSALLAARSRRAIGRADAIVCPTRATARDAVDLLGARPDRLRVVPFGADHGVEPDARPPLGGAPYVLMVGTIEPRKNHLRALAAWRALGPDRPRLVVVGRPGWSCGPIVAALETAAASEPLTWLRSASDRELSTLLAHARALLYPSLFEGFGFPPLEALSHGVPVVCGDTAALREVVGAVAELRDPTDVEALADGLREALAARDDPGRIRQRRARAAIYRWDRCAAAHADLYREVLA